MPQQNQLYQGSSLDASPSPLNTLADIIGRIVIALAIGWFGGHVIAFVLKGGLPG